MNTPFEARVILTFRGPFLTQSSMPSAWGYDTTMARADDGTPLIPDTVVRGHLRQAFQEMSAIAPETIGEFPREWFGQKDHESESFATSTESHEPVRGQLHFTDFLAVRQSEATPFFRISIDEALGSVKLGQIQVIESLYASGEKISFRGALTFFAKDTKAAQTIADRLEKAFQWIPQMGADTSIGFGRLIGVCVNLAERSPEPRPDFSKWDPRDPESETTEIVLHPESLFLFGDPNPVLNLHGSLDHMPGGAIKGAIAETWRQRVGAPQNVAISDPEFHDPEHATLKKHFNKLRVRHARPSSGYERPVVPPVSFVRVLTGDDPEHLKARYHDLATELRNQSLQIPSASGEIAFETDWKDEDFTKRGTYFPNPQVERDLRVRAQMDSTTRKAKDEKLFSQERVLPKDLKWRTELVLSAIPEEERLETLEQLWDIIQFGIHSLGKTKTIAKATLPLEPSVPTCPSNPTSHSESRPREWIVTLQTHALLFSHKKFDASQPQNELLRLYKQYWSALSGEALELTGFLATQSRAGGPFLGWKQSRNKDSAYNPYILTNPGAVFYLKANDLAPENIRQLDTMFETWLKTGIPVAKSVVTDFWGVELCETDLWRYCPYVPENGYGEIAVNLDIHETLKMGANQ